MWWRINGTEMDIERTKYSLANQINSMKTTIILHWFIFSTIRIYPFDYINMIRNKWGYLTFKYCGITTDYKYIINLAFIVLIYNWNKSGNESNRILNNIRNKLLNWKIKPSSTLELKGFWGINYKYGIIIYQRFILYRIVNHI